MGYPYTRFVFADTATGFAKYFTSNVINGVMSFIDESTGLPVNFSGSTDTKDPTGWVNPSGMNIGYNPALRTITLSGWDTYLWRGVKVATGVLTLPAHPATLDTAYFLHSTDGVNFTWTTTPWSSDGLMIAWVWYGTNDKYAVRELHGTMPHLAHEEAHDTIGTYKKSGGTLSSYVLNSTTAANRRPSISQTVIKDEDNPTTLPAHTSQLYTKLSLTGTGTSTYTVETADIVPLSGNNPYYNQWSGSAWVQTLMASNSYMCVWLIAIPVADDITSQKYRFVWMQGQTNGNLGSQQGLFPSDLNLGTLQSLATEFVFIAKVIIQYTAGNWVLNAVTALSGTRQSVIGTPAGLYLSSVFTGTTLSGDGTSGNPLSVVSAPILTTARAINGVNFDGSAAITVYDSTKETAITAGTTAQYWRGDKTWQALNSTAVGLGNVTNESKATMFTNPTFTQNASFPSGYWMKIAGINFAYSNVASTYVASGSTDFNIRNYADNGNLATFNATGLTVYGSISAPSGSWILNGGADNVIYSGSAQTVLRSPSGTINARIGSTDILAISSTGLGVTGNISASVSSATWEMLTLTQSLTGSGSFLRFKHPDSPTNGYDIGATGGSDAFVMRRNAVEIFRVNSSNNLLLGLTNPSTGAKLEVAGNISSTTGVYINDGYGLNVGNFQVGGISANRFYIYNNILAGDNISINPFTGLTSIRYGLSITGNISGTNIFTLTRPTSADQLDIVITNANGVEYNASSSANQHAFRVNGITRGLFTPTGLSVTGNITSTGDTDFKVVKSQKNQTANDYVTAALWTQSFGATATGIAFHISGNVGKMLYMNTDQILYWAGNRVLDGTDLGLLTNKGDNVWGSSTLSQSYGTGLQLSFVRPTHASPWQGYGTVLQFHSYGGPAGGGQIFMPYNSTDAAGDMQYRFPDYNTSGGWTSWRTLIYSDGGWTNFKPSSYGSFGIKQGTNTFAVYGGYKATGSWPFTADTDVTTFQMSGSSGGWALAFAIGNTEVARFDSSGLISKGIVQVANNNAFRSLDTGGTSRRILLLSSSNNIHMGDIDNVGYNTLVQAQSIGYQYINGNEVGRWISTGLTVTGTVTATAFSSSSKRSLKENITKYKDSALSLINKTQIYRYNYKCDGAKTPRIGFMADTTHKDISGKNNDSFDINNTVAVLLKAVQELYNEIRLLKSRNT